MTHRNSLGWNSPGVLPLSVVPVSVPQSVDPQPAVEVDTVSRNNFPKDFIFGTATSAYQVEGAAKEGGRGPSIWDTFSERLPAHIMDGGNGIMAVDSYHQYKDDVQMMKKMGLDAYRFSISWPRILPGGQLNMGVNKEGIKYYNDLIDELLANGIEPYATLFHWDVPQSIEDLYGGFLSRRIVDDFRDFSELCFWEFGDRVKNWITVNEPWSFANGGYVTGSMAPGRGATTAVHVRSNVRNKALLRSTPRNQQISEKGNPGTEPYIVAHHQLLAHSAAVEIYRQRFQVAQKGRIGPSLVTQWMEPLDPLNVADIKAARRANDFFFGWFMEPLSTGQYPETMRNLVGSRLPIFSHEESEKLKGSYDFLGVNYYTATYVTDGPVPNPQDPSYNTDSQVSYESERNGVPIGPQAGSEWLKIYPVGIYKMLILIKNNYPDVPVIYITENGVNEVNDTRSTVTKARNDIVRIKYHQDHLNWIHQAMEEGVNVNGYFIWSFLDNFEWAEGYSVRFGTFYIDFQNGFARYPKDSVLWFLNFLGKGRERVERLLAKRRITETNEKESAKKLKN